MKKRRQKMNCVSSDEGHTELISMLGALCFKVVLCVLLALGLINLGHLISQRISQAVQSSVMIPSGAELPDHCAKGEWFLLTNDSDEQRAFICTSNFWQAR